MIRSFFTPKSERRLPIETPHNPIPSQPHQRQEEPNHRRGNPRETCWLRMPAGHRVRSVPADSDFYHPDCLDLVLADVLRGAGGAVGGVRGGGHCGR